MSVRRGAANSVVQMSRKPSLRKRGSVPRAVAVVTVLLVAVFGLSGCTPVPEQSGCTVGSTLTGGVWFGFVKAPVGTSSLQFDLACFYTGGNAALAASEDGAESPPPNDYYIRNNNPALRSVPIDSSTVYRITSTMGGGDLVTVNRSTFATRVAATSGPGLAVWVYVSGGRTVKVEQQYLP